VLLTALLQATLVPSGHACSFRPRLFLQATLVALLQATLVALLQAMLVPSGHACSFRPRSFLQATLVALLQATLVPSGHACCTPSGHACSFRPRLFLQATLVPSGHACCTPSGHAANRPHFICNTCTYVCVLCLQVDSKHLGTVRIPRSGKVRNAGLRRPAMRKVAEQPAPY